MQFIFAFIDPLKATGVDGIGPRILKSCSCALSEPLFHLFQVSLLSAQLPSEWTIHRISPIFKSGERSLVSNYRPVSLLCSVSKVLESLVYDKVVDFLSDSISLSQFGFQRGKSTLQQLLVFLHTVHSNLLNRHQTDVIYLDFRKAFDSVPHHLLLLKLWDMGITGNLWCWFRSYLSSRTQLVSINGSYSNLLPVVSGVPQGSILGPLLFLVYVNDLPTLVQSVQLLMFADDTKCLKSIVSYTDCSLLQSDLCILHRWSSTRNIAFNKAKSCLLRFRNSECHIGSSYFLDDQEISPSENHRDLGVIVSSDLTWSAHYDKIVSNAYKTLGLIRRTFGSSASIETKRLLYIHLIRSQLTYCSCVWRPFLIKDISLLESVQRRATKWILNDYKSDYKSRLATLRLLPLMMTYELNDLKFFIKSLQNPTSGFNILDYVSFSCSPRASWCSAEALSC